MGATKCGTNSDTTIAWLLITLFIPIVASVEVLEFVNLNVLLNLNPNRLSHVIFTDDEMQIQPFTSPVAISHFHKLVSTAEMDLYFTRKWNPFAYWNSGEVVDAYFGKITQKRATRTSGLTHFVLINPRSSTISTWTTGIPIILEWYTSFNIRFQLDRQTVVLHTHTRMLMNFSHSARSR